MRISARNLFLIDGIGASCSALFLGVIFTQFNELVGIPISSLYLLAGIPCFFILLDVYFYKNIQIKTTKALKTIAFLNFLYCLISLIIVFTHRDRLTCLGWAYILLEILVISVLTFIELRTAKHLNKQ